MIALIVCSVLFIIGLLVLIFMIYDGSGRVEVPLLCIAASIVIFITSILCGTKPYLNEYEKQDLINNYLNCPCEYHLKEIEEYNESIEFGNNLWCRFKIDDRSDWIISIDDLLKETNNEKEK